MAILTASQVYYLAEHYIYRANPTIMTAICKAESGANTLAISPTHDYGLWQINYYYHSGLFNIYNWRDPVNNAQMASSVWNTGGGYHAWATYNNGAWLRELDWARSGSRNPVPVTGGEGGPGPSHGILDLGGQDVNTQIRAASKQLWYAGRNMHNSAMSIKRTRQRYG